MVPLQHTCIHRNILASYSPLRDIAIYFSIGLWLKTIEITLKPVFKFLIACLAIEIFEIYDKEISRPPSWIFKNEGKICLLYGAHRKDVQC